MPKYTHFYLIHYQYLGYRYHGWAKQKSLKTVQLMLEKTINFVLQDQVFKILGSSRTDAMVSAEHAAIELFLNEPLDLKQFLFDLNYNLPSDIRALEIDVVDKNFNIIQNPKEKTYRYFFSVGEKAHPFAAPFIAIFRDKLDIELMQKGAKLFEGTHDFRHYCIKASENSQFERIISSCSLAENDILQANFFPKTTYCLTIKGKGFLRNMVRMIVGQLHALGKGEISLEQIELSLKGEEATPKPWVAPASGLILHRTKFDQ